MADASVATTVVPVVYEWGIEVIRTVQTIASPSLTLVMHFITDFGGKIAYLVMLPSSSGAIDERRSMRLAVAFILGAWSNSAVKEFFGHPRPFDYDPAVKLAHESSPGLPSGHTQNATTFWGIMFSWSRNRGFRILCVVLPLLIAFTRIYLGVHFPTDLFAAWALAAVTLLAYYTLASRIEALLETLDFRFRILLVAIVAVLMNALLPEDPTLGGLFFGMGTGFILMRKHCNFTASSRGSERLPRPLVLGLRMLLGLAVTALIYLGLKALLPGELSPWYALAASSLCPGWRLGFLRGPLRLPPPGPRVVQTAAQGLSNPAARDPCPGLDYQPRPPRQDPRAP